MGRDKVELYARIREDHRQLGLGVRALARKHGVHRRMVREALASPVPAPRKVPVRQSPVLDAVAGLIAAMLREDLDAPRKQRHTSRRIWQRLADEHAYAVLDAISEDGEILATYDIPDARAFRFIYRKLRLRVTETDKA